MYLYLSFEILLRCIEYILRYPRKYEYLVTFIFVVQKTSALFFIWLEPYRLLSYTLSVLSLFASLCER